MSTASAGGADAASAALARGECGLESTASARWLAAAERAPLFGRRRGDETSAACVTTAVLPAEEPIADGLDVGDGRGRREGRGRTRRAALEIGGGLGHEDTTPDA